MFYDTPMQIFKKYLFSSYHNCVQNTFGGVITTVYLYELCVITTFSNYTIKTVNFSQEYFDITLMKFL